MSFSYPQNGVFFNTDTLAPFLWQEPNSGIIIIKPTFLTAKRFDPAYVSKTWLIPTSLNYGGTAAGGRLFTYFGSTGTDTAAQSEYVMSSPKLTTITDTRTGLAVDGNLQNFINRANYSAQSMVWSLQTQVQLAANQAWSFLIAPSSIPPDFADTFFMIAFGGKFILEITMAGIAYMWGDVDGNGTYVHIDTYVMRDGGVNMNQAFQVSVIPLSKRFLSVSFTQATAPGVHGRASTYASKPDSFLTVLRGQGPQNPADNNLEPQWDAGLAQWVKYPAAPITIGLVSNDFDYHFVIATGYFPGSATAYMAKEYPPEKATWSGINYTISSCYYNQYEAVGGTPTAIGVILVDQNGTPYDPASGNALVSEISLSPSYPLQIYTPEIHAYGVSYPPYVQTPDWTPIDVSEDWQLIRFILSTDLNAQRVEMKLLRDNDWLNLMKMAGPCRISALNNSGVSQVLCDFYAERQQPTVEGSNQLIVDQFEGLDMWDRLNNSPLLIETVLEGDQVAVQIQQAIIDAGFLSSEVFIDYAASPELTSMTFGLLTNPNDILRPNSDTSCGDFIRNCAEKIGVQFSPPIRVRWVSNGTGGMWWRIYLGPIYTVNTGYAHGNCQLRFFLDDSLVSTDTYGSDQARWQAGDFIVVGNDEWTVTRPIFNAILASAAKGVDGKEGSEVRYIPAPARVLNDPSYIGFEGGERIKQLATEELQISQTANSVEVIARQYYEQNYNLKRLRHREFPGEWQPEVDVDMFVAIIGVAPFDNSTMGYSAGDPISYGAYRIEHIDTEIRHDFTVEGSASSRWEWEGSYTLTYVGPYTDAGFTINGTVTPLKMWTSAANLPDDYDLPANW